MTPESNGRARTLLTDRPELYEARFPDPGRLAGRWVEDCLRRHGGGRVCWTWAAAPAATPPTCTRRTAG